MPALQGFIVEWPLATPMIGLSKSPSLKPTARSMARLGERAGPWVISLERRLAASAIGCSSSERRSLRRASLAIQYNRSRLLIPFGYEYAGTAPAAPLHRRRRAAALRPRRGGAAHHAAAAVALDPRPGEAGRRDPARALAPPGRAHAPRRALSRGGEAPARAARARGARGRPHGRRRRWAATHRLRVPGRPPPA